MVEGTLVAHIVAPVRMVPVLFCGVLLFDDLSTAVYDVLVWPNRPKGHTLCTAEAEVSCSATISVS